MKTRTLGPQNNPLEVSALGLGCMPMAGVGRNMYGEADRKESFATIDRAIELGVTFFDTAEVYGGGQAREGRKQSYEVDDVRETTGEMSSSERIIGRWMRARGSRDKVTICTKVSTGGSPENIARALRDSLENLRTDHIDVHKMHSWDDDAPIDETIAGISVGVEAGQVGVIGCSNYSADQIQAALDASAKGGHPRFKITQPPYNLARPPTAYGHTAREEVEDEILPLCRREGIAVTPYSPLGAGFLAGKYVNDKSKFPSRTRFDVSPGHADIYFTDHNISELISNYRDTICVTV